MSADEIFQCRKCGQCCKGYGGTYVEPADIDAIAAYLGVDPQRFVDAYCSRSGSKLLLSQGPDGYCVFWDQLCRIHPVKPRMCRAWPFIPSVLVDLLNWHSMAASCPGMRTDVTNDQIRTAVRKAIATSRNDDHHPSHSQ